jgi:hypothetical protein
MKLRIVMTAAVLCLLAAGVALANLVIVSIVTIESNQRVAGFVSGFSEQQRQEHKVVVYLHTDQWHIHREGRAKGAKSFTEIRPDGTWQVKTVRGKAKADKVGAIVVPSSYVPPAKIESLAAVPHVSITIRNLQNTPDYGKL